MLKDIWHKNRPTVLQPSYLLLLTVLAEIQALRHVTFAWFILKYRVQCDDIPELKRTLI